MVNVPRIISDSDHTDTHRYVRHQTTGMNELNVGVFSPILQNSPHDITNFDPEFTGETVTNSVCYTEESIVNAIVMEADDAFLGFSYAPPSDDSFL